MKIAQILHNFRYLQSTEFLTKLLYIYLLYFIIINVTLQRLFLLFYYLLYFIIYLILLFT